MGVLVYWKEELYESFGGWIPEGGYRTTVASPREEEAVVVDSEHALRIIAVDNGALNSCCFSPRAIG